MALALACNQSTPSEPAPAELLSRANAQLHASRTAHMEGSGALSLQGATSFSVDFKLRGDTELPAKSRLTTEISYGGTELAVDTISIDGRSFNRQAGDVEWQEGALNATEGGLLDPLGQLDLGSVISVVEIDRPEVDGRQTRHLQYTADANKLLHQMLSSPAAQTFIPSNVSARGEVWIATDTGEIVRQKVSIAFDLEPTATNVSEAPMRKTTFTAAFDLKFTLTGRPLSPSITAPPVPARLVR